MSRQKRFVSVVLVLALLGLLAGLAAAQAQDVGPTSVTATPLGTAFTYQGQLIKDGTPVNDTCDVRFILYDADAGGSQVGSIVYKLGVLVTGGLFTASDIDFQTGVFAGSRRWLEVAVRCPAETGGYSTVGERQELTATPYALYATSAGSATSAPWSGLSDVPGGFADGTDNDVISALACSGGQVAKWNGSAWACAADNDTPGWLLTGNAGTTPGTHFLGTTDNQALELKVNGLRALRMEPNTGSPNVVGGFNGNNVTSGAAGAAIGGGGTTSGTNRVTDSYGTVAGGLNNRAGDGAGATTDRPSATVGGGESNTASGSYAVVPGGVSNAAAGAKSFAAGNRAKANHQGSFVWADSTAEDFASAANDQFAVRANGGVRFVAGAGSLRFQPDATSPNLIGGYTGNAVTGGVFGATLAGGGSSEYTNVVTDEYGTVGGGMGNQAGNGAGATSDQPYATVGGGIRNIAGGFASTVGGGYSNNAAEYRGTTVAGGENNLASQLYATVSGGIGNWAASLYTTAGGGQDNYAGGEHATVAGGQGNNANGHHATVAGGSGNLAGGEYAMVLGGEYNSAAGGYSLAAGRRAKADQWGSFVWGDGTDADITTSGFPNRFVARASGGFFFYTNGSLTAGAVLPQNAGAWQTMSDRNVKENFAAVDGRAVLDRLAQVPITTWNYKAQDPAIRHIGPVAQDFYAAFGVGEDDKHISTLDPDGVALAAIQGLYEVVQEKDLRIADLEARLQAQETATAALDARVAALEARAGGGPFTTRWGFLGLAMLGLAAGVVLTRRGGGQ